MESNIWGPPMWFILHMVSFNYPVNPTEKDKDNYFSFFNSIRHVLPCGKCRTNVVKNMKKRPLRRSTLKNRESISKWVYELHNDVNKMLCKPYKISYKEVRDQYEHFRAQCVPKKKVGNKVVESGCTRPTRKIKKCKCLLRIVPSDINRNSISMDNRCICKRRR